MTWAAEQIKHILVNFDTTRVFLFRFVLVLVSKNMNPGGSVAVLDYMTPDRIFLKG